jgi:hypothetical protein
MYVCITIKYLGDKQVLTLCSISMQTNGIGEQAARAMEPSRTLLAGADESVRQVENDLKRPLEEAKRSVAQIKEIAEETTKSLTSIEE